MYRVDRREFNINEPINPPETSYHEGVNFDSTIETILEEQKPKGKIANRRSGLFIFTELSDAIRFSCVMTNSMIYKVQPLKDTVSSHRGDMNWTEVMNNFLEDKPTLRKLADLYWDGEKTFKPCWEVLVNKVQVGLVLIPNETERKAMCFQYYQSGLKAEELQFYKNNL